MQAIFEILKSIYPLRHLSEILLLLLSMVIFSAIILGIIAILVMFFVWWERKVAGHIQSRLGPMRVGGWHGWAQSIADGIKLLLKEDIIPANADRMLFKMAPYIVFASSFAAFATIPMTRSLIGADLNIGIFYILAITSLIVIGILMAGWSSSNKWSLYGAMRSAAQIVSYEVPIGLSILVPVMAAGSLSIKDIAEAQSGGIFSWYIFRSPFLFISFFTYYIAAIAEVNRTPFDLPEAESELVAGFHTEYSGMRFAMFFLAEYANMFLVGSIATLLFLGGWNGILPRPMLPEFVNFILKSLFLVFVMIWLRWTLPRLRVDQLMYVCWKVLVPISFFCLIGHGVWMVFMGEA